MESNRSCHSLKEAGYPSGYYNITIDTNSFMAWCDMTDDNGAKTVIRHNKELPELCNPGPCDTSLEYIHEVSDDDFNALKVTCPIGNLVCYTLRWVSLEAKSVTLIWKNIGGSSLDHLTQNSLTYSGVVHCVGCFSIVQCLVSLA